MLLRKAFAANDPYTRIVGCASCGQRTIGVENVNYFRVPIADATLQTATQATTDILQREAALPPALRPVLNIFRTTPNSLPLMLYREYVFRGLATLCPRCHGVFFPPGPRPVFPNVPKPPYSLAAGVNFGGQYAALNLPTLSHAEILCIARARLFVGYMKVSPTGDEMAVLKGHLCCLMQDTPMAFATALPNLDIHSQLAVYFIGTREQHASAVSNGQLDRVLKAVVHVRMRHYYTEL